MMVCGIVILAMGTTALTFSTILEWRMKEPIYAIFMKISVGLLAIGTIFFAISIGD